RTVLGGEVYLTRGTASHLLNKLIGKSTQVQRTGLENLTDRELHVLQLLGDGKSTREIAAELNLSFKTVESHRENIKSKLGLDTAAELTHYANEWMREQISLPP